MGGAGNAYIKWTVAGQGNAEWANVGGTMTKLLDFGGSSAAGIGFYGTAAIAKPAVTGSRGGNAALQDLLTQLAALGLITDSTS